MPCVVSICASCPRCCQASALHVLVLQVLARVAEKAVMDEYAKLEAAILDPCKRGTAFTQPWAPEPWSAEWQLHTA